MTEDYGPTPDDADKLGFQEDVKEWRKRVRRLKTTTTSLYSIVWGQCSPMMQQKLQAQAGYDTMKKDSIKYVTKVFTLVFVSY